MLPGWSYSTGGCRCSPARPKDPVNDGFLLLKRDVIMEVRTVRQNESSPLEGASFVIPWGADAPY